MSNILQSSELWIALIGAAAGIVATYAVQYIIHRNRVFMSYKRFKNDVKNLDRHVSASIKSLEIDASEPRYLIAARLRFCKFMDGMRSIDQLEWLTQRSDSDRILPTLLAIRNSDTFMEEVASRIDAMTQTEVEEALEDARTNMRFLGSVAARLGYGSSDDDAYTIAVDEILAEVEETSANGSNKQL